MKHILRALAIAGVSLSFVPSTAQAQQSSGPLQNTGAMYDNCKAYLAISEKNIKLGILGVDDIYKAGRCGGYIEAMMVTLHFNCTRGDSVRSNALTVTSPTALVQAFVNYARDNPQEWQDPSYFGIGRAAAEYFPCPN